MYIEVEGVKLFFDVEGTIYSLDGGLVAKKPTLMLIPGGPGGDHLTFRPFFSQFSDVAQIIYLDLRGHGQSDLSSPELWNLSTWARDIESLRRALHIDNLILLGHSFGGMLATYFAVNYPDSANKLILSHTLAHFQLTRLLDRFEILGGTEVRNISQVFWDNPSEETAGPFGEHVSPHYCQRWPVDMAERSSRSTSNEEIALKFWSETGNTYDIRPELHKIKSNTLVVAGEKDPISGKEDIQEFEQGISPTLFQSAYLKDCGHFPWWDAPDEYSYRINEFIRG